MGDMEMVAVQSSNVRKVGFLEGVIRIVFDGGATYEGTATETEHQEFLAAPSKGRFVRERFNGRLKLVGSDPTAVSKPEPKPVTMDSHAADTCCGPELSSAILRGDMSGRERWFCPNCGAQWEATQTDTVRHWQPSGRSFEVFTMREPRRR